MPAHAVFPLTLVRTAGLPLEVTDRLAADFSEACNALREAQKAQQNCTEALQNAFDQALNDLPGSPERTAVYNARRVFFQKQKLPAGSWPGRSPQLQQAVQAWEQAVQTLKTARDRLHKQYEKTLRGSLNALGDIASMEIFQRGLLFASHDLLAQIPVFQNNTSGQFNKKQRQAALSLAQYAVRAATKTSPFSRFTSVSLMNEEGGESTGLWQAGKVVVTPNVAILPLLYEALLQAPSFYRCLYVALNPGLQPESVGGQPYFKWLYFDGERESFQHTTATPMLEFLVETLKSRPGPVLFSEILTHLGEVLDAPPEARERFLLEILDFGLLEWQWPERGFSPSWSSGLYQFLGFLPSAESVVIEAAALLQWLRGAARTLPFQPVAEARATQREALSQLRGFLEKNGITPPDISPEQIFYEDVEAPAECLVPPEILKGLADQLADCWQQKAQHPPGALKTRLWTFAREHFAEGPPPDFLTFCEQFFKNTAFENSPSDSPKALQIPRFKGKIGVLLQIFREQEEWRAVVNGLFPGGGKLMARWLHLLPPGASAALQKWWPEDAMAFPWQGWHNANFQAELGDTTLQVPGGRGPKRPNIPLNRLHVQAGDKDIYLTDGISGTPIRFSDLGLEAPETRPPAMQILAQLGLPGVSRELLLPEGSGWTNGGPGWRHCPRIEYELLVLERARWQVSTEGLRQNWPTETADIFFRLREKLDAMEVPRRFFAQFSNEKPQFFDQNSPLLMQLLAKKIRQHDGAVMLTEMLPLPDQCFVRQDGTLRAAEFVVEVEVL